MPQRFLYSRPVEWYTTAAAVKGQNGRRVRTYDITNKRENVQTETVRTNVKGGDTPGRIVAAGGAEKTRTKPF